MSSAYALKFTCSDFTFPMLAHRRALQLLRLLDFDSVDLGVFAGGTHLQPSDVAKDPTAKAKEVKQLLDQVGLQASDVFLISAAPIGSRELNHPEPSVRNELREIFTATVTFAQALGSSHITTLPGAPGATPAEADDAMKRSAEETTWRVEKAREAGITYSIEPALGSVASTPEKALQLLGLADDLTLTLDYTHFMCQGIDNGVVHALLPHAAHFHARCAKPGVAQTIIQENEVDYPAVVNWMRANSYRGYVCLEYAWMDFMGLNRTDNVSETILLRERLQQLVIASANSAVAV